MKLNLPKVTGVGTVSVINSNFDKLAKELQDKVLYRKNPAGEPNALQGDLDGNGNDISNVGDVRANRIFIDGKEVLGGAGGGLAGPSGPAGIAGPPGPIGPSGPASTIGPAGPAGVQGAVGSQGFQGIQGPVGPQGVLGGTGATGPTGTQGVVGPASTVVGPVGAQGITGATGIQGAVGPSGPSGDAAKYQTLTMANPVLWNDVNGTTAQLTLTANTTLSIPSNLKVGLHILAVDQDAVGGRVLTFAASYKLIDAAASTAANTRAIYWIVSDGFGCMVTVYRQGSALTAPAPVDGFPTKVVGAYYETYDYANTPIDQLSNLINVVYLFTAHPQGTPVNGNYNNVGNGSFTWDDAGAAHCTAIKIQAARSQGKKVIMTVGGSQNGFNFTTRQQADNFITSFGVMYNQAGGVDGCDFNNFEAGVGSSATEMVYIATRLKALYGGNNFAITCPPAPDASFAPNDRVITKALSDAGVLTYAAPQFYDTSVFKPAGVVSGYINQWVTHLGDPQKVVAGLSSNYSGIGQPAGSYNQALTQAETEREVTTFLAAHPLLRGVYFWTTKTAAAESNVTLASIRNKLLNVATPIPASDQALTNAMAGQVGAWLDGAMTYLRQPGGAVLTAVNQAVGKFVDRSGGVKDAAITAPDEAYYREAGAFKYVESYGRFNSTTGGGSGVGGGTGFFYCSAVKLNADYPYIYSDGTTLENGRHVRYDAFSGKVIFSVGTGTAQSSVASQVLAPVNTIPAVKMVIKAWQDATNLFLQVNGGEIFSAASAACATPPAMTNYALCGSFIANPGSSTMNIYYHFHTLNPLTASLRDGVSTYISGKIG